MLKLLKTRNPDLAGAQRLYGLLLTHIRAPAFYRELAVPDSFTGRFDLLLAHVFLMINRQPEARDFNQALFDVLFADMDQTLREQGIGDMGVPKHMKRMMKAFNGRMHAYKDGFTGNDAALAEIIRRNIYGTLADVPPQSLTGMTHYMRRAAASLQAQSTGDILDGRATLPAPGEPV